MSIYLAPETPTYYPAEPRFAPDLFAVLEVARLRAEFERLKR
jgi:hypothetical protein